MNPNTETTVLENDILAFDALDDMLGEIEAERMMESEPIDEMMLESAVEQAEVDEEISAIQDKASGGDLVVAAEQPKKKEKAKKEPKAKVAKPKAEKEKVAKEPRVTGLKGVDRLESTLGTALDSALVLEFADAELDEAGRASVVAASKETIASMNVKVKNRAIFLVEFAAGRTDSLNNVIKHAFEVLGKDGSLTMGKEGNLMKRLIEELGYGSTSAQSMGGNTVKMLSMLKVIQAGEKGTYQINPESLLCATVMEKLGIAV